MAKNLVIVESPAKAKTIEKILGQDFSVKSSYGHIRDLPKKGMSIDIEQNFEPSYEVAPDKLKTVSELKRAAKGATVWLATDEDREGEAIAWHLCQALGIDSKTTKRIVFHEITKPAIEAAVKKPRFVDQKLVDAQQARRVLDRLVGYELSPVLWKKVQRGLSAGRVQSVAVRLIVEREREIEKFEAKSSYKLIGTFATKEGMLSAELEEKLTTYEVAKSFLKDAIDAEFSVASVESKPGKKTAPPPFTTSTLQQTASSRLGFSVKQTMVVAQKLYEEGKITYMRTDSLNLAESAIAQAAQVIRVTYGDNFVDSTRYKTKSAGAQEAHEAIRPTNFALKEAGNDSGQQRLYQLIYARALASQMTPATTKRTSAKIASNRHKQLFKASGEVIEFEGWLKLYPNPEKATDNILPPLEQGQNLKLNKLSATQVFSKPKPRYSEASLVKKLEELGIGRPSTYAPTISTIQDRGYVERGTNEGIEREVKVATLAEGKITENVEVEKTGANTSRLVSTDVGSVVTDFLVKHFSKIVDYDFTAKVEDEFDNIADGKTIWNTVIAEFYKDFHKIVEQTENISRHEAIQAKVLGKDPKSGKPVIARLGRYGPMLQIGEAEDEDKPRFASMPVGKKMDEITLEEALVMFELPRAVGKTQEGEEITANIGRFGPYVKFGSTFVSIKGEDPHAISESKAREYIAEKKKQEAEKNIQVFEKEGIKVLNGRYGPYITNGTINARIPKDKAPEKLSLADCQELLAKAKTRPKRRRLSRK